jgi:hypothetical protein
VSEESEEQTQPTELPGGIVFLEQLLEKEEEVVVPVRVSSDLPGVQEEEAAIQERLGVPHFSQHRPIGDMVLREEQGRVHQGTIVGAMVVVPEGNQQAQIKGCAVSHILLIGSDLPLLMVVVVVFTIQHGLVVWMA